MPVFIFDVDTPREVPGFFDTDAPRSAPGAPGSQQRPCYLIGPFDDFAAMQAWVEVNDARLSVYWQSVTLPDATGQLAIYQPEQAEEMLPVLHELPEAKARFARAMAIQAAMARHEAEQEEFVEKHGMPLPSRPN